MKPVLSPKELALAIGVSESSIKRWVDTGRLPAARTAGGHRRIATPEAIRLIRELQVALVRPEILGLDDVAAHGLAVARNEAAEKLFDYLKDGRAAEARGLILSLYLNGLSVAQLLDGPLREALERIGQLWQHSPEGIFVEHRAMDICMHALHQLRQFFPPPGDAPRAVGGAAPNDPYELPTLGCACVLAAEGFRAENLGPNMPLDALLEGALAARSALCWVAVSYIADGDRLRRGLLELAAELRKAGIPLIVGGRACAELRLDGCNELFVGQTMKELVSFARGVQMARKDHNGSKSSRTP